MTDATEARNWAERMGRAAAGCSTCGRWGEWANATNQCPECYVVAVRGYDLVEMLGGEEAARERFGEAVRALLAAHDLPRVRPHEVYVGDWRGGLETWPNPQAVLVPTLGRRTDEDTGASYWVAKLPFWGLTAYHETRDGAAHRVGLMLLSLLQHHLDRTVTGGQN